MANEPVFVDAGEGPANRTTYYHNGLDFGGVEGRVKVVSATEGIVVVRGTERASGHEGTPAAPRCDVVYVLDDRGWYIRYSHLQKIDDDLRLGARIRMGDAIGMLGKEGGSGGWSHLHFDISSRQPSGKWGTEEGYAFSLEAYLRAHDPAVVAVARPHAIAYTGERVRLDATRSHAKSGIARYEWTFGDGIRAAGPTVERVYERAGSIARS